MSLQAAVLATRADLAAHLATTPWPAPREEAWRWFPLRQVLTRRYAAAAAQSAPAAPESQTAAGAIALIWRDGQVQIPAPVAGLQCTPLDADDGAPHAFLALARHLAPQALELRITATPSAPLHLQRWGGGAALSGCRLRVRVAADARVTVLETLQAQGGCWVGEDIDWVLEAGAQVRCVRMLADAPEVVRLARTSFHLAAGARLEWYGLDASCGVSRHELQVSMDGEGASALVRGGGVLEGRSSSETRLALAHRHPGCDTHTLWKQVGRGHSRSAFTGRIAIHVGADRSDAQLRCASLLLDEGAEINVKPELEIDADEVSASHGATVGQLDPVALFYLRSRGIRESDARHLLTAAFLRELYEALDEPLLREVLEARLRECLPTLDIAEV